jgi:hypothetical protein
MDYLTAYNSISMVDNEVGSTPASDRRTIHSGKGAGSPVPDLIEGNRDRLPNMAILSTLIIYHLRLIIKIM